MPRTGDDRGYEAVQVCAYCIEFLTSASWQALIPISKMTERFKPVTASGRSHLKSLPLAKLKKYINTYNIRIERAVEKEDLIDAILAVRVSLSRGILFFLANRDNG